MEPQRISNGGTDAVARDHDVEPPHVTAREPQVSGAIRERDARAAFIVADLGAELAQRGDQQLLEIAPQHHGEAGVRKVQRPEIGARHDAAGRRLDHRLVLQHEIGSRESPSRSSTRNPLL
jgi:hypothetical protein